ncbi:GatB/YqeY domain-containing protein [Candidatus Kaiserbacteria bacterium]|nr:GatB/YqeY domain-containing protein [Candidatus Kaiserbacteria bacterium]
MELHTQLKNELKEALKAKDTVRLGVVRNILTAATNELVATGKTPQDMLDDEGVLSVIKRLAKQRKDSIEQYESAGRDELAQVEKDELAILETYLPQMMSLEELEPIVKAKIEELGVEDKSKMGQLIGSLMADLKGKADGGDVKRVVEKLL